MRERRQHRGDGDRHDAQDDATEHHAAAFEALDGFLCFLPGGNPANFCSPKASGRG